MVPNYDAEAIAEVLGLAFLRHTKNGDFAVSRPKTGKAEFRSSRPSAGGDFNINVDEGALLIGEASTSDNRVPVSKHEAGQNKEFDVEGRLSPPSSVLIERAVESGLPRTALRHVAEWLAGDDKGKIASFEWGVVPRTTLERRNTKLSLPASERTERIARLFVHARRTLGTAAEAREFLTTPHPELEGRTPIEASRTDLGTRRTERLLIALEYGLAL